VPGAEFLEMLLPKPAVLSCDANAHRTNRFAICLASSLSLGPEPTPQDDLVLMLANEATKHLED
jgi:hypothetical protein